jgi:beta-galactosidase
LKTFLFVYSLFLSVLIYGQSSPRIIQKINQGWQFAKAADENTMLSWQPVELPHTWNTTDVMDDAPGYYRGIGVYKRIIRPGSELRDKQLYLFFEGVNQEAEVFVNGKKAGEHTGGYAAFYIPVTGLLIPGRDNEIMVKADNSYNASIPPLSADFTFFGGIYRDVYLVATGSVHFSTNNYGSHSVQITTPLVTATGATVQVKAKITNENKTTKKILFRSLIKNAAGKIIVTVSSSVAVKANADQFFALPALQVKTPQLWSPETPYLYTVTTDIRDAATGKVLDEVNSPLGFRWFHFDAAKGFFLNGQPYKLIGTSRHQDYKNKSNAIPDSLAVCDIVLLKEMGGNFLRVAHYPQDPSVLKACDSLGILASVEIPVVNEITESVSFYENCYRMQVEMIRQHYNHPSVIMWCYMNEVLLRPHYNNDKEKQQKYFAAITELAKNLDSITRKEDPYRYTMMAHHGDYKKYNETGLTTIPMLVGWNLYSGWYGGNLNDFPVFLDSFHHKHPDKPLLVSEYGADADPRIRSEEPVRFDKSIEYTTRFHQFYLQAMLDRPFVAAAMAWNLADFNSETRTESMPHINNKGLLEWDRTPKDPYYYYKAMLTKQPFIKILGSKKMTGVADSNDNHCLRAVQVAGNIPELELYCNGKNMGKQKTMNGLATWQLPFTDGMNHLEVKAARADMSLKDQLDVEFDLLPRSLKNKTERFHPVNMLMGARRSFTDSQGQVWIPEQAYSGSGWGFSGGRPFKAPGNGRLPYGTDKNIIDTENDPIYQTQRIGIEQVRFDVPAGEYELTLYFAELLGGRVMDIPYNLSDADRIEPNGKRIFNVLVNNKPLLDNFNIAGQSGTATALVKKVKLTTTGNEGIVVDFGPVEGEAVLNAVQLKKAEPVKPQGPITTNAYD